jgi:hypothetical protein
MTTNGFIEDRNERLAVINSELAKLGLRPLHKLGDVNRGERELMRIDSVDRNASKFFTTVRFVAQIMISGETSFTSRVVRFNANGVRSDGEVAVVLVNGTHYALVRQWREALGMNTVEVPRAFFRLEDYEDPNTEPPMGMLHREFGTEFMKAGRPGTPVKIVTLGTTWQNTGDDNVAVTSYFLNIRMDPELLSEKVRVNQKKPRFVGADGRTEVVFWDLEKVRAEWGKKIDDNHSMIALQLFWRRVEQAFAP